jgi:hypothetical protein
VPLLRERTAADRPALLVLGVPHFESYGRDVVNSRPEDVLTPERQKQLQRLVDCLTAFRPTRIAVEWPRSAQARLDKRYADFRAGRYALGRNEVDQLGLRLAASLDLPGVDAVDWNEMPPGQESDFDWLAWGESHGQMSRIEAIRNRQPGGETAWSDLLGWLRRLNEPAALAVSNRVYFDYALLGDGTANPGANWVANWYGRNLKIFANLVRIAPRPQDRVLVVYGLGHAFLLRQFAEQSGAFNLEDPGRWMRP